MSSPPPRGIDLDRFRKRPPGPPDASAAPAAPVNVVAKERRIQAIVASVDTLPSLPSVVTEVLRLANDADAGAAEFEEIVSRDQALAAKVLKLVNSPFFGLRGEVTSIPQAIVVMGVRSLRSVVLAAKTSRLLDRQLTPYRLGDKGLWKHSMSCATISGRLAKRLGLDQDRQEAAFVAGLLHDVGKVILAPHVAGVQAEFDRRRDDTGDVVTAERDAIGMSHAEAGRLMGEKWDLPRDLTGAIAGHHEPVGPDETTSVVNVVRLANDLCNQIGVGRIDGSAPPSALWKDALAAVGLLGAEGDLQKECGAVLAELEPVFREMART